MRLFGRHDLLLAAALAAALVVLFSSPVARLLDYARRLEDARGLRLLPALVILTSVFIVHQLWKRQEMRGRSIAADAAAREATARAADLTRLVGFGQALARSLDVDSVRGAAAAHLGLLIPGRPACVVLRGPTGWIPLLSHEERMFPEEDPNDATALPRDHAGAEVRFPLVAGDQTLGALRVGGEPALTSHQQSMLAAAAALLAVSLKNAELFREIRENSLRDALTGCYNRAHAVQVLDSELRRSRRTHTPVSVVMFDLDHFKRINDTYGHLCGDAALTAVGTRMHAVLRAPDLKCRYGGEEFLIVLPDTPAGGASHVAETLRRDLADHPVEWRGAAVTVTASFGVTTNTPGELDVTAVLARADEALYAAKQSGRNCVRVWREPPMRARGQRPKVESLAL